MVKNNPLVTIVIPVYNAAKYMREAIDSALNQTYKNIEIIVVNDGSKDNGETEKIAKSYGNKIKYFAKENGGVSTALNLAIKNMKGEYFSWLSHDDVYHLDKIENQIKYLEKNNLFNTKTIIYSDYELINEKSEIISNCIKNTYMLNEKPLYGILRGAINGITLLIPTIAFKDCGLFDETKRCTQDYELWWEMMKKYKFIHVPEITAKSRTHANQESNVNPRVLSEGEPMWIGFFKSLTDKQIISMEGSRYTFFKEMAEFLLDTPYRKATDYCLEKKNEELKKLNNLEPKDKVSIIIPFYNRVNDCIKALKSALNQTYTNTEIILVNDGSEENIDKLAKIVKENNNCQILDLGKNGGAAHARNMGIKKATGEYIAFLDSDDEFKKDKIEKQLKMMILTNANFSHTSYIRNDASGTIENIESGKQSGDIIDTLYILPYCNSNSNDKKIIFNKRKTGL
jgi:glycosyltransferase involved in cell wall biosynthesis